jgi:hypothetical protein
LADAPTANEDRREERPNQPEPAEKKRGQKHRHPTGAAATGLTGNQRNRPRIRAEWTTTLLFLLQPEKFQLSIFGAPSFTVIDNAKLSPFFVYSVRVVKGKLQFNCSSEAKTRGKKM